MLKPLQRTLLSWSPHWMSPLARHSGPLCPQVAVNTSIDDVNKFMEHIMASTNMKCLTPPSALSGDCGYLAANLYAKVQLVAPLSRIPLTAAPGCWRPMLTVRCPAAVAAQSVFGEDALANLSVEKQADGKLAGYIRIRSKTQGIALSLGDKITLKQNGQAGR